MQKAVERREKDIARWEARTVGGDDDSMDSAPKPRKVELSTHPYGVVRASDFPTTFASSIAVSVPQTRGLACQARFVICPKLVW